MLVLKRCQEDRIVLQHPQAGEIVITVCRARGPIRLGIQADQSVKILRGELRRESSDKGQDPEEKQDGEEETLSAA